MPRPRPLPPNSTARFRRGRLHVRNLANKPTNNAVIFDMDGTLANVQAIRHHIVRPNRNFDAFHSESIDSPTNQWVADLARYTHHSSPAHTLVVTARSERYLPTTIQWLHENGIPYTDVFARPDGDFRPDFQVKEDILRQQILPLYKPILAVDDNPNVVALWKKYDIPTIIVPGWND